MEREPGSLLSDSVTSRSQTVNARVKKKSVAFSASKPQQSIIFGCSESIRNKGNKNKSFILPLSSLKCLVLLMWLQFVRRF